MRNIKLTIQYNGSRYHGWQIQPNGITIQETVNKAIFALTGETICVCGCGRTDAKVHAKAYVCNFHTNSTIPDDRFYKALNVHLPEDIVCIDSHEVPSDFSSADSLKKRYTYVIHNSELPNAFENSLVWHFKQELNIDNMKKAAKAFIGEHDFKAFVSSGFTVKTTVRTVYSLDIKKENDYIYIDITANGFLYNMVRIITGTLVFCGIGKIDWKDMPSIIDSLDRTKAGITAPPDGLYLSEVFYK